eukprot:6201589-Pleurochrysis_carterae.AAC.1
MHTQARAQLTPSLWHGRPGAAPPLSKGAALSSDARGAAFCLFQGEALLFDRGAALPLPQGAAHPLSQGAAPPPSQGAAVSSDRGEALPSEQGEFLLLCIVHSMVVPARASRSLTRVCACSK